MRSENEIREHLEWLKSQCTNFKDGEEEVIIRQLETLLWVLGHEREEAKTMAHAVWSDARDNRRHNPQNY